MSDGASGQWLGAFFVPVTVDWVLVKTVQITLIGKPGCHLCDDARGEIARVREALAQRGIATQLAELDILEDERLARLHSEDIPVVLVEGKRHSIWRVDPGKLESAIERAAKKRRLFRAAPTTP